MAGLDKYLVTLGIKGQDVVLSVMDKIRKKGEKISKSKDFLNLGGKGKDALKKLLNFFGKDKVSPPKKKKTKDKVSPPKKKKTKEEEKNEKEKREKDKKFAKAVDKFSGATTSLAHGVSSLNPTTAINSGLGALAKMTGIGIPFAIAEAIVNMASNTIEAAKANASAQYGLTQRNATAKHYGGKISDIGGASNEEMASLRTNVGASFGKVQKPLADAINKLTQGKNKYDQSALTRVASGNWRSTGTDKGWMLQQLSDSFGNLPPSIAQKFQATLLSQFGAGEIQEAGEGQRGAQATNASWTNASETQTAVVYKAIKAHETELFNLNSKLNTMQAGMVAAGAGVVTALNYVTNQINAASTKMNKR